MLEISAHDARRLSVCLQGLAGDPGAKLTREGLQALIEHLGFVQVDSISIVERAHHMILFSRNQTYRQKQLVRLLEKDRSLFENWTHDASVIPSRFYPYWRHRFRRRERVLHEKFVNWFANGFEHRLEALIERIRADGALRSRDVIDDDHAGEAGWWNWHPGKTALEYLWQTGALAVARREGFQKVYDLSERVIPREHYEARCDDDACIDWACRSALSRLGFGSAGDIARFWDVITVDEAKTWLDGQSTDCVRPVLVHAADGSRPRKLWALPDIDERIVAAPEPPGRLRVLNPFDPMLRDRKRLQWIFNFDYRIEVFVPAEKRTYGYYIFPLLEGDRLIGRIDMKADRKRDALVVTAVWLEPKVAFGKGRQARLEAELDRIRRFSGVARVDIRDGWIR